ncbi:DUF1858 domain-containing protein [Tropicimonas isoalkanivorans]|uniref:Hybrid cluster protein-associated redox disulfide domain-containing protein n=1 Tax=Tropicimonas isoalkanivorans TaxID=441112 RepID=A0A1I1HSZ1_9RHOB|nr:DUF1858 domain-containing protein [Tropicimonas isoalkanivorans]SFC25068.1 hybrid cluster protein-associated redox disulfide domain-containing protein [Tropicimonas isoalkanivorans]
MRHPDPENPDLPLATLLAEWPGLATVFWERRMLCPGCPIAPFHTVADVCTEYGLNETEFRAALMQAIRSA